MSRDNKSPLRNCDNLWLPIPIQMQVSKKQKLFLNIFLHFRNLHQILNFLKKKMIVIANVFPKLQAVKDLVTPLSKKHRLRTPFDNQQTLVKSS